MISVVLATYNEESTIERCLSAVKSFADEMIVVDGSSSDQTRKLAQKLGAKVIKTTNKPNFHINKQQAIDEARGDLVLQLDADEVVDDTLAAFIIKTHTKVLSFPKANQKRQVPSDESVAWWVKRKNLFLGHFFKKTGQYPDPVIRLFINGYAKLPQKDVHEQMKAMGKIGWAEGHLIHYANPSFSAYLRKWNTYTSFKAKQLLEEKVKISVLNLLKFFIWLPTKTFLLLFVRHKGFMDGWAGFVFSVMSGLYHPMSYLKLWELYQKERSQNENTD